MNAIKNLIILVLFSILAFFGGTYYGSDRTEDQIEAEFASKIDDFKQSSDNLIPFDWNN